MENLDFDRFNWNIVCKSTGTIFRHATLRLALNQKVFPNQGHTIIKAAHHIKLTQRKEFFDQKRYWEFLLKNRLDFQPIDKLIPVLFSLKSTKYSFDF